MVPRLPTAFACCITTEHLIPQSSTKGENEEKIYLCSVSILGHFVECDDDCSAETDVVLKSELAVGHLPFVRFASQLPRQLGTLSNA